MAEPVVAATSATRARSVAGDGRRRRMAAILLPGAAERPRPAIDGYAPAPMRRATVLLCLLALGAPASALAVPFPRYASIVEAQHYAAHRLGNVSFAAMRTDGTIRGLHANR